MNLNYGILSEKAEDTEDGVRKNILGTINQFSAQKFPAVLVPVNITMQFSGNIDEEGEHRLFLRFVDSDHQDLMEPQAFLFKINERIKNYLDAPSYSTVTVEINKLQVNRQGYNEFLIYVDDEFLGSVPLYGYENPDLAMKTDQPS